MNKQNACQIIIILLLLVTGCGNKQTVTTNNLVPSLNASPTALILTTTPAETAVQAFLKSERCKRFGETIGSMFNQTYKDKGCKLPTLSPDGKSIAYITLSRQSDSTGPYFSDTLRVLNLENDSERDIFAVIEVDTIENVEWLQSGELLVWENVYEGGHWLLYIYEPVSGQLLAKMATDDLSLHWNNQKDTFYVTHYGSYGNTTCIGELDGYDFKGDTSFPDIKEILWPQQSVDSPEELDIEPFAWSEDGKRLWLTVTPLFIGKDETGQFEVGPSRAVLMEFSKNGIEVIELASDPASDFSFAQPGSPEVISSPYQLKYCPLEN
jgi:hypothetical protein